MDQQCQTCEEESQIVAFRALWLVKISASCSVVGTYYGAIRIYVMTSARRERDNFIDMEEFHNYYRCVYDLIVELIK